MPPLATSFRTSSPSNALSTASPTSPVSTSVPAKRPPAPETPSFTAPKPVSLATRLMVSSVDSVSMLGLAAPGFLLAPSNAPPMAPPTASLVISPASKVWEVASPISPVDIIVVVKRVAPPLTTSFTAPMAALLPIRTAVLLELTAPLMTLTPVVRASAPFLIPKPMAPLTAPVVAPTKTFLPSSPISRFFRSPCST